MCSAENRELKGWLLDVYPDREEGVIVWIIGDDGHRYRLTQDFSATFYVRGDEKTINAVHNYLEKQKLDATAQKIRRKELFEGLIDVLAVNVHNAALQPRVFKRLHNAFPHLEYFDAEISLPIRYHTAYDVFPLAFCRITINGQKQIQHIEALDLKWDLAPTLPGLRILSMIPNADPSRTMPTTVELIFDNQREYISLKNPKFFLQRISSSIDNYDPDIIGTIYGDKWLFPFLFSLAERFKLPFNPNREKKRAPVFVKENTFTSYGRIVHRDRQTLLFGRAHIDTKNSMAFWDYGLLGAFELARITGLPLQNAARRSPGGGFTAMQVRTALQNNILIPVNKKQRERYKSASELIAADKGGFVYQPIVGLHRDVAELDFFSMYPSIMAKWNISPETVGIEGSKTLRVPGLNRPISQDVKGVVASILEPVLEKRRRAKASLAAGVDDAEDAKYLDVVADTLKGLGWVSFGYQGFSGNRIGSIEAHESITAISRELTLRAKEAAEELGFLVLHMYVDCLFLTMPGKRAVMDFQPLVTEIGKRAEIPIELEGIFNWIAFLPSKESASVPVPNCYFGVFQNGELKCRGIMARKHDTPLFIKQTQLDAIHIFAREPKFDNLRSHIPKAIYFLRSKYSELISGQVPAERLRITQRLNRDLDDYRVFSATARAGLLLTANQRQTGAGHSIEYLHVKGSPDVLPWELSAGKEVNLDLDWYGELFFRAAHEILQPFGVEKKTLIDWIVSQAGYFRPEDYMNAAPKDLPLFEAMWEVSKGPLNSSGS